MEEPSVMGCSSMGYHSQTPPHPTTTATTFENSCYRSLLDSDVVSDDDSDWREDEWPQDRPLPLPEWGRERASLAFASLRDYMSFLSRVASHQRQTISIHPYDSVSNFIEYYFAPSSSPSSSSSSSFVIWEVEENRSGRITLFKNIIHVSRPFLSGVNVTERRNLPYHFRILLGRDASGKFTTGLYFHIKPAPASTIVTFLHKVDGEMKHVKKPIDYFLPQDAEEEAGKKGNQVKDGKELNKKRNVEQEVWKREEGNKEKNEGKVDKEVERAVMAIEDGLGRVRGEVQRTLVTLACLLKDEKYVAEFCKLNNEIEILRRA
ncbi:hypothetical protein E2C01_050281 [Portunus trituberculatus]|uniref:Uncharacterized protein n=1 Tax=Portunus trituberculatus TaxID=210409 RepID=A0A5B7GGB3_PORTR|nr:hypothetical protein [Portunus trituberculatus]